MPRDQRVKTQSKKSTEKKLAKQRRGVAGGLDLCFGTTNTALNIVGLVLILMLVMGALISVFATETAANSYWATASPILGSLVGFVCGQRSKVKSG
jgi:hypothetical protein